MILTRGDQDVAPQFSQLMEAIVMLNFDTVVVSDLHLGARNSRGNDFLRFLHTLQTDRLVLAGDLFNDHRLRGLQERDVQVVELLRQYARGVHVDWVVGNHDPSPDWFAGLLGITAVEEVILDVGRERYLVYHGHGWDPSLTWPQLVVDTADAIYFACQWLDPSHRLARSLKRSSKHFLHVTDVLRGRAIDEAQRRDFAGVILGHSHLACEARAAGVHYLNSGCWTEKPSSFVGIRGGRARLYDWDPVARAAWLRETSIDAVRCERAELAESPSDEASSAA
jgi:UDP-2,3-diacylglucosamine pyrophosphatase LpxH